MKIYIVTESHLSTGTRIEGVDNKHHILTDNDKAIDFAHKLAKKYHSNKMDKYKKNGGDKPKLPVFAHGEQQLNGTVLKKNPLGTYMWPSSDYDLCYPSYTITVKESELDMDSDVVTTIRFNV